MNFSKWLNANIGPNQNDLQPNEAAEMGWFACKEEVLKILEKYHKKPFSNVTWIDDKAVKEIEKL